MSQYPRSAYDLTGGVVYFARMLDKIRLHAAEQLPTDYHEHLGGGFDGRMCRFLKVDYDKLRQRVLTDTDGADETILEWCYTHGRRLDDLEILVWNGFATKRGWRDEDGGSAFLAKSKAASGFMDRADVQTLFDYYDVDEKRRP